MTSYLPAVVNIALSYTIFDLLDIEEYCGLERLRVTQGYRKWHHSVEVIRAPIDVLQ